MYRYNVVPDGAINRWKIFDNQENKFLDQVFSSRHIAEVRMKELSAIAENPGSSAARKPTTNSSSDFSEEIKKVMDAVGAARPGASRRKAQVIMDVVGTPEKNRELLVKTLFLDLNMTCTSCNLTYATAADLEQLQIEKYRDVGYPDSMTVYLTCHCGHSGEYTFKPNPFMMTSATNVSHDAYGTGVNVS